MRRLVVVLILAAACRGGSSHKAATGSGSASGSGVVAPAGPHVELTVDGGAARTITVTAPTKLAALVPTTPAWLLVSASADDGRFIEVQTPATTYPDADVRLDARNGRVVIGVYRAQQANVPPAVAELAAHPVVELTSVQSVEVWTHAPPPPAQEAAVTIEIAGKPPRDIAVSELETLKEAHDRRMRGWPLRDVVGLVAHDTKVASVRVVGEGGETATVTAAQLAGNALLKRNQRGQLVYQMWDAGADQAQTQVRGVKSLVIETAR